MLNNKDHIYLHQALSLANIRRGFCAPNPSVGAVVVKDNKIIAEGYHFAPGSDHAEVNALKKITGNTQDATIYVTLEPCCHWGKTPPCSDALIQAGVKRVVYAYRDPNPLVSGAGEEKLLAAGIACEHVPLPEIDAFYASYHHWHKNKKPFVTAKIALSLNGKIAGKNGERIQITGAALQELTHAYRKTSDAILTTAKTIIADDPQLNVRIQDEIIAKPIYILDSHLTLPMTAKIFTTAQSITVFHSAAAPKKRQQSLTALTARCIQVESNQQGLDFNQVLDHLGQEGIHDLWVEAGGTCFSSLFHQRLLQRALIYVAPRWLEEGKSAFSEGFSLESGAGQLRWQQAGKDAMCEINW